MRAALFIDGKNFYQSWKDQTGGRKIDFPKMAEWVMRQVGCEHSWGVHYYTGMEDGVDADRLPQRYLAGFLNDLERLPGFFVYRFPRKRRTTRCEHCGESITYTQERQVDTTMVADMLRMAAVDAFDVMVLVSGDGDHRPAVEGVKSLGKVVYVASWSEIGMSPRLRKAAFDHIDLTKGMGEFELHGSMGLADEEEEWTGGSEEEGDIFIEELQIAERRFEHGYVGLNYFIRSWKSSRLEPVPQLRSHILDDLVDDGRVEIYEAEDGSKAIRVLADGDPPRAADAPDADDNASFVEDNDDYDDDDYEDDEYDDDEYDDDDEEDDEDANEKDG